VNKILVSNLSVYCLVCARKAVQNIFILSKNKISLFGFLWNKVRTWNYQTLRKFEFKIRLSMYRKSSSFWSY